MIKTLKQLITILNKKGKVSIVFIPLNEQYHPMWFRPITFTTAEALTYYEKRAIQLEGKGKLYMFKNEDSECFNSMQAIEFIK